MPTYVAFLRAINLGKNRKLPMAEVRSCLESAGYGEVATHIQTGNVLLRSPMRSREKVEAALEKVFAETAGFEVPTIVTSPTELASTYAAAVEVGATAQRRYVTFLKHDPPADVVRQIDAWDAPGEGARVLGRAVHWWIDHPTAAARFSNASLERLTGPATTRDLKVVAALVEKWC
jgi:uncharacterized protein (DUF1697 family)